ncbi:MAG: glucose-6-phosphate isomerase [Candidatus Rokubacteria bacterium]|nr:glucose-6-phosphate isomerase [Candidatus Rokubacteria bacterium]
MSERVSWERFKSRLFVCEPVDVGIDLSRMTFGDAFLAGHDAAMRKALAAMDALEAGAIANPDEQRMVGHYWLRDASRAPTPEIAREIRATLAAIKRFARGVHAGRVKPPKAKTFRNVLVVGIGGSALGPQFVARALGDARGDRLHPFFFDNTDPDGIDAVLGRLGANPHPGALRETLVVVVSKSGGTPETRNGMLEARRAWEAAGLDFARHAVAVTQDGSQLDRYAREHGWLRRFPMWDWVGGRTSEMSAVGLLPAALQGVRIDAMLAGARAMDGATREKDPRRNPAALLALAWYHAGGGRGLKDMVILPYKDRLELFSRYLQQLVMESLGKERDLDGRVVNQGIAVYGNKGSTDQHAYVQQLRDGVNNFFVTFIAVLRDRAGRSMEVEPGVTSGDYLSGFLQGTRRALWDNGRESVTITVPDVSPETVGKLIALYERAVGLYASLVNVNAYHQPGVEAGKKAAAGVLDVQKKALAFLRAHRGKRFGVEQIAAGAGLEADTETVFTVLQHLAANPDHRVRRSVPSGGGAFDAVYSA